MSNTVRCVILADTAGRRTQHSDVGVGVSALYNCNYVLATQRTYVASCGFVGRQSGARRRGKRNCFVHQRDIV